jgi:hypothetical protein
LRAGVSEGVAAAIGPEHVGGLPLSRRKEKPHTDRGRSIDIEMSVLVPASVAVTRVVCS